MMRLQNLVQAVALERRMAGQQVIQRAAERINVGADVGLLGVERLLRRNVVGRAHHLAALGQPGIGRLFAGGLGQAEVENLDDVLLAHDRQHQVVGLDVAMDHPFVMGVLQSQGDLLNVERGIGHRQRAALLDHLRQILPQPNDSPGRRPSPGFSERRGRRVGICTL